MEAIAKACEAYGVLPPEEAPRTAQDDERAAVVDELLMDWEAAGSPETLPTPANEAEKAALVDELIFASQQATPQATETITELFESGPGAEEAGSTVWGAYNAVTGWMDHHRGRTEDTKLYNAWIDGNTRQIIKDRHDCSKRIE